MNEDEAAEYAALQANMQTPLELVGDIPLAGAMAKSLKGMLKGKVTTSQMANWIQATVANLAKATAGETLITTPGQSIMDQLTAQEYGVRDPMSWGDLAGKTGQDMKVSLAQGLLMSGGSLAVGGTGRTARSWLQSAHAEPPGNAAAVNARGAQLVILREERGRIVMALASTAPESARAQELVERLGYLDTQIARVEVTGAKAMRDHLLQQPPGFRSHRQARVRPVEPSLYSRVGGFQISSRNGGGRRRILIRVSCWSSESRSIGRAWTSLIGPSE